jgi:GNAT superfamily N-acetyltransferase
MGIKIPPYEIRRWTNSDPGFYESVGPFLSRREVVAELGAPVWDDDNKTWLVAQTESDEVLGFVSFTAGPARTQVSSLYVLPDSRRQVVGFALLNRLLSMAPTPIRAVATRAAVPLFELVGFTQNGQRGQYAVMEKA